MIWRWHIDVLKALDAVWRKSALKPAWARSLTMMPWPYIVEMEFIGDRSLGFGREFRTKNGMVICRR